MEEGIIISLILISVALSNFGIGDGQNTYTFDVVKFGAVGDGKTDDSPVIII